MNALLSYVISQMVRIVLTTLMLIEEDSKLLIMGDK